MLPNLFAHPITLATGLLTGIVFGFLIQKAQLSHFKTVVGQFLLKDFTMIKVMLTAIFVGSIGIYAAHTFGLPAVVYVGTARTLGIALGATLMGIGIAILGYYPAACVAAAGQGSKDAYWGLLGMVIGAGFFAQIFPGVKKYIFPVGVIKTKTLPDLLSVSPWLLILLLGILTLSIYALSKRKVL